MADDLGWGDVSFHGSDQIPTPNIDTLASNGIILNNFYVSPMCSPSRSALLTGYHPIHTGQQHWVITSAEPRGVPLKFKMLPEYLRNLGYSTVLIGKWHQGFYKRQYIPTERGFDSHFGFWTGYGDYYDRSHSSNWWGIDLRRNEKPENLSTYKGIYSTEMYTIETIKTITNHSKISKNPLFIYLAFQAVHRGNHNKPFQAPRKYYKKFTHILNRKRRIYAAMVSALDDAIGIIFTQLCNLNLINNTIIIFTTDNGAYVRSKRNSIGSNWPLRGSKLTLWEGGTRVVAFIWSLKLKKSYISDHLMHIQDLMPTIYSAAGGDVKNLGSIDGIDHWNIINNNLRSPRRELLYNIDEGFRTYAIRKGDYKLISGTILNGIFDNWFYPTNITTNLGELLYRNFKISYSDCPSYDFLTKIGRNVTIKWIILKCDNTIYSKCNPIQHPCLFNIRKDPCEYNNIAFENPRIVRKLKKLLQKYNATAVSPKNKHFDKRANPALHNNRWDIWD